MLRCERVKFGAKQQQFQAMKITRQSNNPAALRRRWESVPGVRFAGQAESEPKECKPAARQSPPQGWVTIAETAALISRDRSSVRYRLAVAGVKYRKIRLNGRLMSIYRRREVEAVGAKMKPLPELREDELDGMVMQKEVARRVGMTASMVIRRLQKLGIEPLTVLVRGADGSVRKCRLHTEEQVEQVNQLQPLWRHKK